jgi:hypothetical protein
MKKYSSTSHPKANFPFYLIYVFILIRFGQTNVGHQVVFTMKKYIISTVVIRFFGDLKCTKIFMYLENVENNSESFWMSNGIQTVPFKFLVFPRALLQNTKQFPPQNQEL